MQLYADIRVNGQDIRDRWPSPSFTTFPLSSDQERDFADYLTAQKSLTAVEVVRDRLDLVAGNR